MVELEPKEFIQLDLEQLQNSGMMEVESSTF